jgi:arylformamidase
MNWIDLTQTITKEMPGVSMRVAKTIEKDGWNARMLDVYTHAGTHADAPIHFGMPGPTIDEMPLEKLMATCWVITIADIAEKALIKVEDLGEVGKQFKTGQGLLLKTGWSKWADVDPEKYRDGLPRISEELARWCVDQEVSILAVEAPSVADVNNLEEVTRIHRILFGGQVFIVEGICNTESLDSQKIELMVLPLKIKSGDGAPARVIARPLNH